MLKTKSVLYLFCLVLATTNVNAQYFNGGLFAGINAAQVDGDNLAGYNKPGINAGFFVQRTLNVNLFLQLELKYSIKGAAKYSNNTDPTVYKLALHYVEMPALIGFGVTKKLDVELGPSVAYLFAATNNFGLGTEALTYHINKYDVCANAGFNMHFNEHLALSLRFNYSMLPISHQPGNLTFWSTYGQYNHMLSTSLYYTFR